MVPESWSTLEAIVFDVDGTLYRQAPLRRAMLLRLVTAHALQPLRAWQTMRVLRAYRDAQEHLRASSTSHVATAQVTVACESTGVDRETVVACVERWMEREPLPLLSACIHPGVVAFLRACKERGIRLAALSDYPVDAKLSALGIADFFDATLSAQSAEIGVFKPNPRGLVIALERLGCARERALYVGDRVEVDASAAAAAGVACAIIGEKGKPGAYLGVASYHELHDQLFALKSIAQ